MSFGLKLGFREKVEEKKPKRVTARGGGVQLNFGGAVAKGDGASAINEAVALVS